MDIVADTIEYASTHLDELFQATIDHIILVAVALFIGIVVCVPLGIWSSRSRNASIAIINSVNGIRVIPSLAILFLAVPYLGVGLDTAIVALTILAMPPILVNTDAAFRTIDPAIREAAAGMGMTSNQTLVKVEFPLAMPVILTGIRTATTEVIASATLAAFIGAGGLGIFIQRGYAMYRPSILLVGAIPVAFLAVMAELSLSRLQKHLRPPAPA